MIYFLRHAHREIFDSSLDNGLSEKGWKQCPQILNYFVQNRIKIDEIHSSPKLRCLQTTEFVAKNWKLPVSEDWDLIEAQAESSKKFTQRVIAAAEKWKSKKKSLLLGTHGDVLDVLLRWGDPSQGVSISKGNLLIWNPSKNIWLANPIQFKLE